MVGLYALSGFYSIPGNEKGVVRRFGRLVLPLQPSGLHYDWPYPFAKVDRINFAAVQTVTIGQVPTDESTVSLGSPVPTSRALLTGDQNLLQIRAQVLYRPSETDIDDYLFSQTNSEMCLKTLAEAELVGLISRSGVDFAHVRGLSELNERLTSRLRAAVIEQRLGIEIEQAVIEQVEPPLRVKAEFLDVSNARAEQARSIQEARTWAEQQESQAKSEQQRLRDDAVADRLSRVAAAEGSADRFRHLVAQLHAESQRLNTEYAAARGLLIQRMSWQTLAEIWPKIQKKTIVDAHGPVDVGVFPKRP